MRGTNRLLPGAMLAGALYVLLVLAALGPSVPRGAGVFVVTIPVLLVGFLEGMGLVHLATSVLVRRWGVYGRSRASRLWFPGLLAVAILGLATYGWALTYPAWNEPIPLLTLFAQGFGMGTSIMASARAGKVWRREWP